MEKGSAEFNEGKSWEWKINQTTQLKAPEDNYQKVQGIKIRE